LYNFHPPLGFNTRSRPFQLTDEHTIFRRAQALQECRADAGQVGAAKKAYWSAHQRFFKLMCVSIKVPTVVAEAKRALEEGKCVVIGLQARPGRVYFSPRPSRGFDRPRPSHAFNPASTPFNSN